MAISNYHLYFADTRSYFAVVFFSSLNAGVNGRSLEEVELG